VVEGKRAVNIAAFAIHSSIPHARPDVVAAAHSHSLCGKAWASLGRLLDPITQDACAFFEDHVVFEDFTGVVYETSEGERIAKVLGNHKAAILQNHGLLTVGQTVDEAAWWFITMDRSCHAQLLAQAAGKPALITRERALATRDLVGTHQAGWFQFQPLWEMISQEQQDLLD
jgi:ribulose-5-phosphate 4-epimerase/fuculose-1-phosphate aldolase